MKLQINSINSLLFISALSVSSISCANDNQISDPIAHGEKAHETHCYKCHTDKVYIREDRFVRSIDALSKQVERCKNGNDVPWFEEDTGAVVQFLNEKYYRF
jgi:hypothetical protein